MQGVDRSCWGHVQGSLCFLCCLRCRRMQYCTTEGGGSMINADIELMLNNNASQFGFICHLCSLQLLYICQFRTSEKSSLSKHYLPKYIIRIQKQYVLRKVLLVLQTGNDILHLKNIMCCFSSL